MEMGLQHKQKWKCNISVKEEEDQINFRGRKMKTLSWVVV